MKFFRNSLTFGTCTRSAALAIPAAALFAVCTPALHAQYRASLTGTVTDTQGALIPGATLTLIDLQNGKRLEAKSNASGFYTFNALPPDSFSLNVTMAGFTTTNIANVAIVPEQPNNVDVRLEVGGTNTTVTVEASTVQALETSTASLSGTVSSDEIQHLPSAGRDVFQLAQLTPGAFGDGQRSAAGGTNSLPGSQGPGGTPNSGVTTENGPQTLSNGGQYETNSINIDGISTVSSVWGGTTVITPNEDSIDTLKVTSNGYDAEFGRFSGANMQVTTKSGTNQVHGSFFFRVARPGLNAFNRYNGPASLAPFLAGADLSTNVTRAAAHGLIRDTSQYNDFGGSIGGPILKGRLFAFFAYETYRQGGHDTPRNEWYQTAAFDAAAPSGYISNVYNTFPGHSPVQATMVNASCGTASLVEGVNCRTVAGQGIDVGSPLKTAKGTLDPTYVSNSNPGVGGGLDGVADIALYQVSPLRNQISTQYNGRLDADATRKDHLTFAIYWVPLTSHYINGPARGYNQWNHSQVNDAFSVIYNHVFSSSFLNEARVNAAGYRWNELTTNPQEPFGLAEDDINQTGSAQVQYFGAAGPSHLDQWTYGLKDVATKVYRTHTIKFGFDGTRLQYLQDPLYAARPSFNFQNIWNYLNDAPYQEHGTFNRFTGVPFSNRFDQREYIYGGFAQDDWKATPSLTISYGLRYNYFNALYSKQNNEPHVQFGSGAAFLTGITLVRGGNVWTPDKGNFGPQLGFAYNPSFFSKRMVVRGGYGLNFNQEEIAISANGSFNPNDSVTPNFTASTATTADPNIQYNIPSDHSSIFGYAPNKNTIVSYNPTTGLPTTGTFNLTAYPNHLHTQQVSHYSLDVQTDLGHSMVATVGYTGSTAKHLIFHQNLNIYAERQGIAPNPIVPFLEYYGDTGGSNYNALLVDLKHNLKHNFLLDASFTYSKSMDDNSGPYSIDPYTYNPVYNRARSDFNFGKAFKLYGLYSPKFYYGTNKLVQVLANGFNLSGIFNLHTGFPWTPVVNYGTSAYYTASGIGTLRPTSYNHQGGTDRSNQAFMAATGPSKNFSRGGTSYFTQYTPAQLVPTSFPTPIAFYPVPGISRNAFDGPRYSAVDATVTKAFGVPNRYLGERTGVEFRVDAFNVFNKTNLSSNIINDINNAQFGISNGGLAGRQVQMQARLSF